MVQWENAAVESRLKVIDMNMMFLLLGLYGWEYFQSLEVEYAVIRGRLPFRWPLVPYLVGRLFQFVFLLLTTLRVSLPVKNFACLVSAMTIAATGDIGLGCASINFMIRTWMIWKDSHLVHILLLVFALGHWVVLALDIANLHAYTSNGMCRVLIKHPKVNAAVFIYTLCYDFVVLVLSVAGLSKRKRSKSPLIKQLHAQGLWYFAVTVVFYIAPTVFSIIGVTPMVSITGLSALTASTIASCRAVRSLLGLRTVQSSTSNSDESTEGDVALTSQIHVQAYLPTNASVP